MSDATNALVTGPPRSGKTTALERTVSRLREDGYAVGGLSSPERREAGRRAGFDIVDVASGERAVLARVDGVSEADGASSGRDEPPESGASAPTVGKYTVDVSAVDRLAGRALPSAVDDADCVVIDEIAPMQLESDRFVRETTRALESSTPVLAAIKLDATDGFLGAVKKRSDTERFVVEPDARDALPETLAAWVRSRTRPR
ncbi:nucleotide kinase [Haloterrigena sp. SYSU A121-1]|uniref:Nucleoside-triphosphatase HT576_19090 n=1 Tax=Haloterrigena gelatinilytica TaxID=2741724 RepID=A0A8J8KD47_9EURY|nr:nucleoside-triphosphatase [Haloterrigena gelatinilytica]NUB93115.1 nucleotide kinase [Haloterrigena gelatinilytica]